MSSHLDQNADLMMCSRCQHDNPPGAKFCEQRARRQRNRFRSNRSETRWSETLGALASVQAGCLVDGDEMLEWISSWGKKTERKPPL